MRLTVRRLTAEAFAPFGQVLHAHVAAIGWRARVAALEMAILDRRGEYVVLRWDDGSPIDTEWRNLPRLVLIEVLGDAPCQR